MTRGRLAWIVAGSAAALLATFAVTGVLVLRSDWFRERVRRKLVAAVETATGGRVEVGSVTFDWSRLRAAAGSFTIHGTEPPDKPPLFHAASVALDLKIVSIFKRKVDLAALDEAVCERVMHRFDHANLNLDPLFADRVPTTENLCRAIFELLRDKVPAGELEQVRVEETENNFFECSAKG